MRAFLLMLVAASVFASCKDDKDGKDDPSSSETEIVYYDLALDATDPSDNNTTITDGWNWKSGDQIAFVNLAYSREIVTLVHNGANFCGSVPSVSGSVNLGFFYPTSALTQAKSDITYVRISLARQDGVNVPKYLAGNSTATVNGTKFYRVISGTYDTKAEAAKSKNAILGGTFNPKSDAWILAR